MNQFVRGLVMGGVLALGIGALTLNSRAYADDDDKEIKEAQDAIVALAKDIEDGKPATAKVAAIKKKFDDLGTIMQVYKPRAKKGLGFGPTGEGIEAKLNSIGGKKGISKADLTKFEKELIKVSNVNLAMVEVLRKYPPKPKNGKTEKDWNEYADAMKSGSLDLIKAVKAGDSAKVKSIAANISNACNNCHTDFRD
jgi:hypothetical protein